MKTDKLFQIKHKLSGRVLFELKTRNICLCLEVAVSQGADLAGADLRGADLTRADLAGADLRGAYLRGAYLMGADLRGADLTRADLRGVYLTGADLAGADLRGVYLTGADLRGAYLAGAYLTGADGEKIDIKKTPLQILGLYWDIIIFDKHMKIGCEFHAICDWQKYNDDRISKMDRHALEWWKGHKKMVLSFCEANRRG